jgi:hypothetical protein
MTRNEAVAQIKMLLGFTTILTTTAEQQLRLAQEHFEQNWPDPSNLPWFLMSERATVSLTIGEERVQKPDDHLGDAEDDDIWVTDTDGQEVRLRKNDTDNLRKLYGSASPGLPIAYSFDGFYYRLFPAPNLAYTTKIQYMQKDTVLNSDIENLWLAHAADVLVGRATAMMAGAGKNQILQIALGMQNDCIKAVNDRTIWLKETNRRPAMGEDL